MAGVAQEVIAMYNQFDSVPSERLEYWNANGNSTGCGARVVDGAY